jgi:hypothetical protein
VHDFKRNGLVSGIKDIGEYWKTCKGVVLYSQKLWEVLNGTLDQEDNKWEKCQSAAYMTKLNIRYTTKDELTTPGKGFVERILKHKRIQIIKNILFRSKNTHGRTLTINRKSKNGEIENKKIQRTIQNSRKGVRDCLTQPPISETNLMNLFQQR